MQNYRVTEGVNDSVSVEIRVLTGMLGRPVMVRVFTVNDSALGKNASQKGVRTK